MPDLTPDVERELAALDDALAGRRVEPDLTELGQLALALRETRPRPTDGFGRFLDTRLERGFPGRDPRVRASGRRWWEALLTVPAFGLAAAVLIVAVIVVAGPSGSDDSGGSSAVQATGSGGGGGGASEGAGGGAAVPEIDRADRSSGEDSSGATSSLAAPSSVPPVPGPGTPRSDRVNRRAVERSASLTLAVRPRDIDAAGLAIQDVARRQGGFVVSSAVDSRSGGSFELRVPTRNLDEAIAELSRRGSVRDLSRQTQDITTETVSARSRLKDARTERKSLLSQLADAVTPTETEAIRRRLDIVSREIERARAGVRRITNRAAFSTVAVTLVADRNAGGAGSPGGDEWTPGDAAKDALRVLEVAAGVALIVLAVAAPLALLAAFGGLAARWSRRRRREHALDAV